ncbi:protein involved in gliding motility GldB [Flavobacterium glycines]|uniref:Gliding motility lipoprotein GldB n=1 Tax=Flavobacterium glycines TaxID=551990 RepID=A0A1B9DRK4_9FLAO|nr:gliding motility lipoprotein GldB [Flavobacterium glycines]OCB72316.1 gliding motility lipoprotein GldB [Flavobacterium glycines]GEL09788.1 gliding motility lipoprotein GldB [Flavobacterium glycines]SDI93588.1 protein involved in gliding motility GldB [Flavobacterium glycines]
MKTYVISLVLLFFFFSCDTKNKNEKAVEAIPLDVQVIRFDKIFFETAPKDLPKVKKEFPFFFPEGNDDSVWLEKMQNPLWRELYTEVQNKFSDFNPYKKQLVDVLKRIKYNFPKVQVPKKVYTIISEMDYTNKVIYADSLMIISLEMYLGKEHKFYQFPNYIKQNFEPRQLLPDVVESFARRQVMPARENNFLSAMIYAGKSLYLKDVLLDEEYTDEEKMGYTLEQLKWCEENEDYIWRYFIEGQLLYSDDQKLIPRFVSPAPFSKFYLEIDNESPGRVGAWIGWQIVRSYMKNNEVSLPQLMKTPAKEIFEKSNYKPKK